jgi:FtsZ-binding cell division protein ZapB
MGNFCCSEENLVFPSEDKIKEIINFLKIRQLNIDEIKEQINIILTNNSEIDAIKEEFSKIFYETDASKNFYINCHKEIFNNFFEYLESGLNINQLIFLIFPLSKVTPNTKNHLIEILEDLSGPSISYERIKTLLQQVYEFYTIKITKDIKDSIRDEKIEKDLKVLIDEFFTEVKIEENIKRILMSYEGYSTEERNIGISDLVENLDRNNFKSYEEIRFMAIFDK